jgi:DNA invertase Pin-like site-specific DNA recombinase
MLRSRDFPTIIPEAKKQRLIHCVRLVQKYRGFLMTVFGYARVSTDDQTLDLQYEALARASRLYQGVRREDKRRAQRPAAAGQAAQVVAARRSPARSTHDLQALLKALLALGADFKVLDNPTLDTTTLHASCCSILWGRSRSLSAV